MTILQTIKSLCSKVLSVLETDVVLSTHLSFLLYWVSFLVKLAIILLLAYKMYQTWLEQLSFWCKFYSTSPPVCIHLEFFEEVGRLIGLTLI